MTRRIKIQALRAALLVIVVTGAAALLTGVDRAVEVTNYDQSMYLGMLAIIYLVGRGVTGLTGRHSSPKRRTSPVN